VNQAGVNPPVVLLHGLASSFEHNWREPGWYDLLTEAGRDVLTLDLPGHGKGPHETVPEAYADVPGEMARRIEREAPDARTFDAVGFSMGGYTLLSMASADPSRYRRLAILGVGDAAITPTREVGPPGSSVLADAFTSPTEPDSARGRLFWRLARSAGNDPAALSAFVRRPRRTIVAEDLARIDCPVLVVIGDKDTAYPADALVAALPQGRLHVLRGTDHFATTSDYRCLDAVLSFLAG
jgi:pimeloyl-ACP methyl ester carboxylesterase